MIDETGLLCGAKKIHFSAYWNPTLEFDPCAPKGMKLWADVLADFPYALYGKVSVTGTLGIPLEEIPEINAQVQAQNKGEGGETHLYLFNTALLDDHPYIPPSLHVARVETVTDEAGGDRLSDGIPKEFYDSIKRQNYIVPIWFQITDLREIPLSEFKNLEAYYPAKLKWDKFDSKNKLSPLKVRENKERIWFKGQRPKEPHKAWHELVRRSSATGKREPLVYWFSVNWTNPVWT